MHWALCAAAAAALAASRCAAFSVPWPPIVDSYPPEPEPPRGGSGSKETCRRDSYLVGFGDEYFTHQCRELSNPDVCPERCQWKHSCAEYDSGGHQGQVYVQGYWPNSVPPLSCCANAAVQTHSCRWRDWYAEDRLYHDEVIADVALRFKEPTGRPTYTRSALRKKSKERLQRRLRRPNVRPKLSSRKEMRRTTEKQAKKEARRRCSKAPRPQRCMKRRVASKMKRHCARGKAGKACRRAKARKACRTKNCMRRARRQRKLKALARNNPKKAKEVRRFLAKRKKDRQRQSKRAAQRATNKCKQRSAKRRKACVASKRTAAKRNFNDNFEDESDRQINVKFCMETQQRSGKKRNMCTKNREDSGVFPAPTEGYYPEYTDYPDDYGVNYGYTDYPEYPPDYGNGNGETYVGGVTDYPYPNFYTDDYNYTPEPYPYGTWPPEIQATYPPYPPKPGKQQEQRVNIRVRVCKVALNDNCEPGTGLRPTGPRVGTGGGGGATEIVIKINVTTRSDKQWLRESVEQGNVQIIDGEQGIYPVERCGEQEYWRKYRRGCDQVKQKQQRRRGGK